MLIKKGLFILFRKLVSYYFMRKWVVFTYLLKGEPLFARLSSQMIISKLKDWFGLLKREMDRWIGAAGKQDRTIW